MRIGQRSIVNFVSEIAASIIGFVATVYFARVLGADVLGVYFLVIAIVIWLQIFGGMGVQLALKKYLSEDRNQGSYLSAGIILQLAMFGIIAAGAFLIRGIIADYLRGVEVELLLALFFGSLVFAFVQNVLDGYHLVGPSSLLKPFERLFRSLFQIGLVLLGFTLTGMLFGYLASTLVITVVGFLYLRPSLSVPERQQFVELFDFARYSWLGSLGGRAFASLDTVVLGLFVAEGLIGVYEVAWNIASILAVFGVSITRSVFPTISKLSADENLDDVSHLLVQSLRYTGLFIIPGLVGAAIIGEEVLAIYGEEFRSGGVILLILVTARMIYAYQAQFTTALKAIDRPDIAFRVDAVFVALNLVLNLVLVWAYGWYGAAVATTVSAGVGLALGYWGCRSLLEFSLPLGELSRQTFAAVVMGALVVVGKWALPVSIPVTILLVLGGAGAYGLVMLGISARFRRTVRANVPM
jgi:O-antigen/teichoic acid export membrane protein